ncbi:hypothetical protein F4778DRAFT_754381 [Xylariomycetidae sp. FL2044]|nr:hypothetical protein F4778DRAFT_754381 [Xylariomycetidae sp. FL2044]
MQLQSLFTAAGLAVSTTNAFLLPPEISPSEDDILTTLPVPIETEFDVPHIVEAQNIKLKCPGCSVSIGAFDEASTADIPTHLELDFTIEPSLDGDRLLLNGFELYPHSDPFTNTLNALVRPDVPDRRPGHFKGPKRIDLQTLGFGLQTQPIATSDDDDLELVMVDLQIIEVGNAFVDGIPNVQVKLIKTPSAKLMIGSIDTTESANLPGSPMDKQEECTTLMCKWQAMIKGHMPSLGGLRHGCGSRLGRPKAASEEGQHHHGGHSHHQERKHSWVQLFKTIAFHILLPIAIGIVAGVTASILGMLVGTFIVFLWRTFVRSSDSRRARRHGGHHHKAAQHLAAMADEKSGLMAEQDELEAPPVYVEDEVTPAGAKGPDNEV